MDHSLFIYPFIVSIPVLGTKELLNKLFNEGMNRWANIQMLRHNYKPKQEPMYPNWWLDLLIPTGTKSEGLYAQSQSPYQIGKEI